MLTILSFGLYLPVWFGQTWSELKRVVRDPGMSPLGHALTQFVPIYNLFRAHAHFRAINEQRTLRGLSNPLSPRTAVAGILVGLVLGGGAGKIPDAYGAFWLAFGVPGALLLGVIMASGQKALNRIWEHDFGAASKPKPSIGEWIALIGLGIVFALVLFGSLLAPKA